MEELENIHERETETKGNGSQVFTEPYSEGAIQRLKKLVVTFFNQGERKYYSILVDGETVVPKTCDGRKFNRYIQFLNEYSQTVEVRLYQGYSANCNKHRFILNKALSGVGQNIDVNSQIQKALEEDRMKRELEDLRKDVKKKRKKIEELEVEIEDSGSGIEKLTEFAKNALPLAAAFGLAPKTSLAGTPQAEAEAEVEVEIEKESNQSDTQADSEVGECQKIFNDLVKSVGEDGIKNALGWMTLLSTNPEIQRMIKEEIKKQKEEKDGQA